ncbi:MAG: hypothetical protein C4539_07360 [Ignavibacteriales bacterium]|nr:MAG: hypothetical protein C4539_07360 [Ignavibacteriales bacterium]
MANFKKAVWQILLVSLWINIFETIRWILFAKPKMDMHFKALNLVLPNEPINNILWFIWGIIMAIMIFIISKKFRTLETTFIVWITVYVMHWIALWNSAVLPINILLLAVPLTFINVLVGALICSRFKSKDNN